MPALVRLAWRAGLNVRSIHTVHALQTPRAQALVDSRRALTYAELDREIDRFANALAALGVTQHSPVGLALENCAEYIVAWFALLRLNARAVHASFHVQPPELRYVLDHSKARLLVVGSEAYDTARAVQRERDAPPLRLVHVTQDSCDTPACMRYERLVQASPPRTLPSIHGPGAESVVYTSGTTGRPKGAARDLGRFGITEGARLLERLPVRLHERHLLVTPLHHSGAQGFTLLQTALGCSIRLEARFDASRCLELLEAQRIHSMFVVPTMMQRMLDARDVAPTLPDLRGVVSGAAEFPHPLRERAIRFFGAARVLDFYGATELGWVTLIDGHEMLERRGSVGRPLAGQEIAIFDRQGARLPTGAPGLIYVRNQQLMEGYVGDSEATAKMRRAEWMTAEDVGYLDPDGYLYVCGRERDMVKSGGVNIYPAEIEEVLVQHPEVKEVGRAARRGPSGARLRSTGGPAVCQEVAGLAQGPEAMGADRRSPAQRARQGGQTRAAPPVRGNELTPGFCAERGCSAPIVTGS